MDKLIVFGGGGYCGGVLVPQLLDKGYDVTVFDTFWYGKEHLQPHKNLTLIEGDVRDINRVQNALDGQKKVLHLACISNDSSFHLDDSLSTSVNYDSFAPLVNAAKAAGVERFVFASSSSVYGVSEESDVTEDHPLVPLTLYNKYKGLCEPVLLNSLDKNFSGVVFRPATVCGYSPRLRLDLSVNILTHHAVTKNKITVFGGDQLRPNLHIQDYADLCCLLLSAEKEKINGQTFNCGYQNLSIKQIANLVKQEVEKFFPDRPSIEIEFTESDDNRSYHINSDKIAKKLGFQPKHSIAEAVADLCIAFRDGLIVNPDDDQHYNVKTMLTLKVK